MTFWFLLLLGSLLLILSGPARAQIASINQMLIESYDLLTAGKLDQAKVIFRQILKEDPGNPLALNNLGAVMVKEKRYQEAMYYLEQALPRARGYRVKVNGVCDVEGLCLAFRPAMEVYGNRELAPLVQLNLEMVKARLATRQ